MNKGKMYCNKFVKPKVGRTVKDLAGNYALTGNIRKLTMYPTRLDSRLILRPQYLIRKTPMTVSKMEW